LSRRIPDSLRPPFAYRERYTIARSSGAASTPSRFVVLDRPPPRLYAAVASLSSSLGSPTRSRLLTTVAPRVAPAWPARNTSRLALDARSDAYQVRIRLGLAFERCGSLVMTARPLGTICTRELTTHQSSWPRNTTPRPSCSIWRGSQAIGCVERRRPFSSPDLLRVPGALAAVGVSLDGDLHLPGLLWRTPLARRAHLVRPIAHDGPSHRPRARADACRTSGRRCR